MNGNAPCSIGSASSPARSTPGGAGGRGRATRSRPGTCSMRSPNWSRSRWSTPTRPRRARPAIRCSKPWGSTRGNASTSTATADGWRRRHAEYFAAWAEEAGPGLVGPDEFAWRARENADLDNLRAAVTWALDRDDPDDIGLALRIIGALADESPGNPAAGMGAWAEQALPHVEITSPQLRYAVIAAAAWHQFDLGNYQHAQALAQRAIGDGVPPGARAAHRRPLTLRTVRRCSGSLRERWRSRSTPPACSTATTPLPWTPRKPMGRRP